MNKLKSIRIFLILLFLPAYICAEDISTFTVTETLPEILTQHELNKKQAISEITLEKLERNIYLGRGYFGHIYPCYIETKLKDIEIEQ